MCLQHGCQSLEYLWNCEVIAKRGQKNPIPQIRAESIITVIGYGSSSSQTLPPFIIYDAKQLNLLWTQDEVSGSRYAISNKGVDQELFYFLIEEPLPGKCCIMMPPSTSAGWILLTLSAPVYSVFKRKQNCYLLSPYSDHPQVPALDVVCLDH